MQFEENVEVKTMKSTWKYIENAEGKKWKNNILYKNKVEWNKYEKNGDLQRVSKMKKIYE